LIYYYSWSSISGGTAPRLKFEFVMGRRRRRRRRRRRMST